MESIWEFDPETIDDDEDQKKFVIWHTDVWLPEAVGLENFGETTRSTNLITDKVALSIDIKKEKKVLVPITGEAFGLLMFANCRDRWLAVFDWQAKNPHLKTVPSYRKCDGEQNIEFKNRWSGSNDGERSGGGWNSDAFLYYNDMMAKLKEIRKKEADTGQKRFLKVLEYLKAIHSKKRKGGKEKAPPKKKKLERTSAEITLVTIDE